MRKLTVWLFKENGKFYCEETIEIPEGFDTADEIKAYIEESGRFRGSKHVVIPMSEPFIKNAYPCMITAKTESAGFATGRYSASNVKPSDIGKLLKI